MRHNKNNSGGHHENSTGSGVVVSLSPSLCAQTEPAAVGSGLESADSYQIVERGPHHRVWSKVSWVPNPLGELEPRTNAYVELTTGLHYRDPVSHDWRDSDPSFELSEEGYAVARRCQHQVIISPNLNSPDGVVVDLHTADGQRLRSGIIGLKLFDPVSGKRLQIAAVRDATGTLVSSNEVVWFDAFEGLQADVRVRNERGQFHQDVVLREKLSPKQLTALGFDPNTVRLEVWTEFVESPEPVAQRTVLKTETNAVLRATMADPDEVDHVLKFGSEMQIGPGGAFIESDPHQSARVFKQRQRIGDRRFLIEAIPYRKLLPLLEALPLKSASLDIGTSSSSLAVNRIPPERAKASAHGETKVVLMAKLNGTSALPGGPRVVLDYPLTGTLLDYTLRGDTTFYVSGFANLTGTSTIEGGTVVKFAPYNPGVYLQFEGTVLCKTRPYRPAIFTARDDNTVGELISGSTGTPSGYYASTAIYGPSAPTGDLHHLVIRHARYAITWYYDSSRFSDLQLVNCYYGIGRSYCAAPVHNVLLNNVVLPFWGHAVNYDIEHATVNQCSYLASVYGVYSQGYINLTNCVLANIGSWGSYNQLNADYNGLYNTPPLSQAHGFSPPGNPPVNPFVDPPVGAGKHYLAAASGFQNVGTTSINQALLADLTNQTTIPPIVYANQTWTTDHYLSRRPIRDDGNPDLGFHYAALDYALGRITIEGVTLKLMNGVAVACFLDSGYWGAIVPQCQATVRSVGDPVNMNRIVWFNTVQEQSVSSWNAPGLRSSIAFGDIGCGTASIDCRFTEFSRMADPGDHIGPGDVGSPGGETSLCGTVSFAAGPPTFGPPPGLLK